MQRKIIHIDADCFYAAIEMRDNPELQGIPMAVGGSAERRGVLTTCNYDARAYGVRSAMPTAQAMRLCPQLTVVPPQMHKYREASKVMRGIFANFTEIIEPLSLDEAYLDVSEVSDETLTATRIAKAIRQQVREELDITVSAGVSVNKFIAKVASDWKKPDGLTVVPPDEVDAFVAALSVKKIPGVGAVTADKMHRYGLRTCADVRQWSLHNLRRRFGKFGVVLHERARGRDERPVQPSRVRKSVSVERTFAEDVSGPAEWAPVIERLYISLMERIEAAKAWHAIDKAFIKLKFNDFTTTTVERVGTKAVEDDYRDLLLEGWERKSKPVRLIGLGVRLSDEGDVASARLPFSESSLAEAERQG
ncbi:MAG: DNA polymerase IV [Luminiphilus sp.]